MCVSMQSRVHAFNTLTSVSSYWGSCEAHASHDGLMGGNVWKMRELHARAMIYTANQESEFKES